RAEPQQNAEEGGQVLPVIITELTESGAKGISVGANQTVNFTSAALQQDFLDVLLLVQKKDAGLEESPAADSVTAEPKKVGFFWYVRELLRHNNIWRGLLLGSLSFQVVGLSTPLFTQVIIDTVIAHHSESTLLVLGTALVVFMLFTSTMTWLREYLI